MICKTDSGIFSCVAKYCLRFPAVWYMLKAIVIIWISGTNMILTEENKYETNQFVIYEGKVL